MSEPEENPDPWCTSPDPEPAPEVIVVQAEASENWWGE